MEGLSAPPTPQLQNWQLEWELVCATAVSQLTLAMGRLKESDSLDPDKSQSCRGDMLGPFSEDGQEMTVSNSAAALGFEDAAGNSVSHLDFVQEQAAMALRVGGIRTAAGIQQPAHDYLLKILDSCERAHHNSVQLPLNPKAPKFINDFTKIDQIRQAGTVHDHTHTAVLFDARPGAGHHEESPGGNLELDPDSAGDISHLALAGDPGAVELAKLLPTPPGRRLLARFPRDSD